MAQVKGGAEVIFAAGQTLVEMALPYIVGIVVASQTWIVKQIIDVGKWRTHSEGRSTEYIARFSRMEQSTVPAITASLVEVTKWQAMANERCKQHQQRDQTLEKEIPIALKGLADHGNEMDTIRESMSRLDQRLIDGFAKIDERLARMQTSMQARDVRQGSAGKAAGDDPRGGE